MFRWLMLISCFFFMPMALAFPETPTFIIESDRFAVSQQNDYRIGNFERELSVSELLDILQKRRYEKSDRFAVKFNQYLYVVYVLENRSARTQTVHVRFPLWFIQTRVWLVQDDRLEPLRPYPRWGDTFYIDVPPGVHRMVGMRLAGSTQSGQARGVRILDFQSLEEEWRGFEMKAAIVFGAVVIMVFYNFGMYLVYRRIFFVFYMIYSGAALHALAMIHGYVPYRMPDLALSGFLGSLALLLFCNSSLNTKQKFPRVFQSSLLSGFVCFLLSLYSFVTGHWLGFALSMPLVMSFCFLSSVVSLRSGYQPALYFVIGWGVFLVCCTLTVLNIAFLGRGSLQDLILFGFAAEISLFSFAIGQKVRLSEQKALRGNQHAFNQLKKVFYPHQITMIKAGLALEETMPTSQSNACALCFDIVRSSQIESSHGRGFIEHSLKACESALTDQYDAGSMVATGYRVKEMGDGFLCTVGYPFQTVDALDPAVSALELALTFIRIFQQEVDALAPGQLIYCSVGLGFGLIQGHFPKVGVVEYEVDGRAVDLAQRYEAFRKLHFPDGPPGHMITIHAAVHEKLPAPLQKNFNSVDLRAQKLTMRDDPSATHVYYCILTPEAARDRLPESA